MSVIHCCRKTFLYGFVLFRQQRDESRSRGYFQKSLVLVCDKPYVDLYDRVLRVIGPLFFQVGKHVLQAVYENIHEWYGAIQMERAMQFDSCIVFAGRTQCMARRWCCRLQARTSRASSLT